jgi:hypothetical protein
MASAQISVYRYGKTVSVLLSRGCAHRWPTVA